MPRTESAVTTATTRTQLALPSASDNAEMRKFIVKTESILAAMRACVTVYLLFTIMAFSGWFSGCAGKGQLNPATGVYDTNAPASQIVVAAENIRATALEVFDAFMQIE